MQSLVGGRRIVAVDQIRRARPANFDPAEQIRLRPRQLVEPRRLEMRIGPENLHVGLEAHLRAAPVVHRAQVFQLRDRRAALVALHPKIAIARDLNLEPFRQRIHHRGTHAVQSAAGLVRARLELSARMQRRHDDLKRRLRLKLGMRIDRNAAPVVAHGQNIAFGQFDLDAAGMPRNRLVHRIVDYLGRQMMQRALVGAADIHARSPPDRLKPFKDLDVFGGIAAGTGVVFLHVEKIRFGGGTGHRHTRTGSRDSGRDYNELAVSGTPYSNQFEQ